MSEDRTCPECGATLSDAATEGLCQRCLLNLGLEDSTEIEVPASTGNTMFPARQ